MMRKVLSKKFFDRPTIAVAKDMLGKFLVRKIGVKTIAMQIIEVEAYDGPRDLASHASRGLTERNKPMFGEAGHFYVYFTYGMHWMLNVVTGQKGYPAAVLIRAGKCQGSRVRGQEKNGLINGPARLTKYLKIDRKLNGLLAAKKSGLWLEARGLRIAPRDVIRSPRIGVAYAGRWAKKKYNFRLRSHP